MTKEFLRSAAPDALVAHFSGPEGEQMLCDLMVRRGMQVDLMVAADRLLSVAPDLSDRLFAHAMLAQGSLEAASTALAQLLPEGRVIDRLACAMAHRQLGDIVKARLLLRDDRADLPLWQLEKARLAVLANDHAAAIAHLDQITDPGTLKAEVTWLSGYLGGLTGRDGPKVTRNLSGRLAGASRAGDRVRLAVLDYKTPEPGSSSMNIGDWMQSAALLRHLVRHFGADLTCDHPGLDLRPLRDSWPITERITGAPPAHLALMDRDFPEMLAQTHPGQPVLALLHGWFLHRVWGQIRALPLPDQVTPIILSFYLQRAEDLTPEVVDFLKANAPIGCRDRPTCHWLLNSGIEAFFSGCVTTTMGLEVAGRSDEVLEVDTDSDGIEQNAPAYRRMDFAEAIATCLDLLTRYGRAAQVTTSRLHCYLPARAIGASVAFTPKDASDRRFDGLIFDGPGFETIRTRVTNLIDTVLDAVRAGTPPDGLRALWRETTAPLVAEARADLAKAQPLRRAARPVPPSPTRSGVDIVIALDQSFVHRAGPFLRSVRAHSDAQIDMHVLTRGIDAAGFARLQAEAPALRLHQITMDGRKAPFDAALAGGANSVSTMDRLLLPELLPDLDRVVYLDCDTVLLADVAELAALPVSALGIAGRATPNRQFRTLTQWMERAIRLRGYPQDVTRELRRRIAAHGRINARYINAGVMVLSLDRLRAHGFVETVLALVERYGFEDQEAINMYLQGDFAPLPEAWNMQPYGDHMAAPKLIHWVGARKPWITARPIRWAGEWRRYARNEA